MTGSQVQRIAKEPNRVILKYENYATVNFLNKNH